MKAGYSPQWHSAKINHKISQNDRLYLSAYLGRDAFGVNYDSSLEGGKGNQNSSDNGILNFGLGYGNITSTLRWNHLFNNKLFSNTTFTFSRYSFNTDFGLTANQQLDNGDEILSKKVKKFKFTMDKTTHKDQDVPPRLA